jgi:hypothetical protein
MVVELCIGKLDDVKITRIVIVAVFDRLYALCEKCWPGIQQDC